MNFRIVIPIIFGQLAEPGLLAGNSERSAYGAPSTHPDRPSRESKSTFGAVRFGKEGVGALLAMMVALSVRFCSVRLFREISEERGSL